MPAAIVAKTADRESDSLFNTGHTASTTIVGAIHESPAYQCPHPVFLRYTIMYYCIKSFLNSDILKFYRDFYIAYSFENR